MEIYVHINVPEVQNCTKQYGNTVIFQQRLPISHVIMQRRSKFTLKLHSLKISLCCRNVFCLIFFSIRQLCFYYRIYTALNSALVNNYLALFLIYSYFFSDVHPCHFVLFWPALFKEFEAPKFALFKYQNYR